VSDQDAASILLDACNCVDGYFSPVRRTDFGICCRKEFLLEGNRMPAARMLVIDDDPDHRKMVRAVLETAAFDVGEAVDGVDGLMQVRAFKPDLILLDLIMPGLDGHAVCRTLKEEPDTRGIPVIVFTGSPDPQLHQRVYAAGAVACLTKPFRPPALLALVHMTLQGVARRELRRKQKEASANTAEGER
jgi:CheY-like chemotaxis protein